jgi:hypothetical protein
MKRLGVTVFCLLLCHGLALGQGYIGVFADPLGTSCEFDEVFPGVIQVYIVHIDAPEAIAAQFMIAQSDKFKGSYLGEAAGVPNIIVGNSQTGISAAYGECKPSPIHILTISYFVDGTSDPCSYLEVVPDPANIYGGILMVDCADNVIVLDAGGRLNFNVAAAAQECHCGDPSAVLPAEDTTWGHVKALYRAQSLQ